jgi:type I restriction enzyme S subunit
MTGNLPNGWELAKLEDVVDILDSKRVPINSKERETRQGPIPYYGATGQVGWIDDFLFDEELVLLGEDGAPFFDSAKQKAYVVRGKSWVNNHAHVLRAKNGIPNAYIKYYLDIVDYHGFVTGTTRHKLNQAAMRQIPIPVAPPEQQKHIVAEIEKQFSRLDEAVANLKRVKANLKRYKAAVLKAAVEGRLVETEAEIARHEGRSYETGEQLLQRILETRRSQWKGKGKYKEPAAPDSTDLPELPEGWVWASVDQLIGDSLIGLDRGRDQQNSEGIGTPYVKMNNVTMEGKVTSEGMVYVVASRDEKERFNLQADDLLFNTRNSKELVGKVGIVRSLPNDAIYNNNLMRLRAVDGAVPSFICSQMCSDGFRRRMELVKKATTNVAAVYAKDLFPLSLALPPLAEQHRIVAEVDRRFSILRETEAQVDANVQRAERLRSSTLGHAFSGGLSYASV